MKITSQEEYALRCVLQLARRGPGTPVSVAEIGRAEGLSGNYVNKILLKLHRRGIVRSVRGVKGGYVMDRRPDSTTVAEVLEAVSGPLFQASLCKGRFRGHSHECRHNAGCGIRPVWEKVVEQVDAVLSRTTLADVLEPEKRVHDVLHERLLTLTVSARPPVAPVRALTATGGDRR